MSQSPELWLRLLSVLGLIIMLGMGLCLVAKWAKWEVQTPAWWLVVPSPSASLFWSASN